MMKVNNGNAFIHPATGQLIGPGHIYFVADDPVPEIQITDAQLSDNKDTGQQDPDAESNANQDQEADQNNQSVPEIGTSSEVKQDGSGEADKKTSRGNRRQSGTVQDTSGTDK